MTPIPSVSIILPVYNQERLLPRAVESVLQQTSNDWQLIIVNDGSTDSTASVAKNFAKRYSGITFLDNKHRGVSATINAGVFLSKSLFVTTLDADDFYQPDHIQDNLEYIHNNPKVDLIMSKTKIIGSPYVVDIEQRGQMIHLDNCVIGGTFFVRRSVFNAVGGRSAISYGTDYYFAKSVMVSGYKICKRNTRTYVYDRTGDDSITKLEEKKEN